MQNRSYNANHQLTTINTTTGAPVQHRSYNNDGHLIQTDTLQTDPQLNPTLNQIGTQTLAYNAAQRLTTISHNSQPLAHYHYDPFGRRIAKTSNSLTTWFGYDQTGLIAQYDASGNLQHAWGYSPHSGSWQTSPLYQRSHSSQVEAHNNYLYHYYQTDHLGTPLRMTTATGVISWQAHATAFGEMTIDTAIANSRLAATNHHRFPGQYYDVETGLHYNYFRDYEASVGRYVQRDPIGLRGGVNVYGYVGGNPVYWGDPTGEVYEILIPGQWFIPFLPGGDCGEAGSWERFLVPDGSRAQRARCQEHDRCYERCAKYCMGEQCKLQCDGELGGVYGFATKHFADDVYEELEKENECKCGNGKSGGSF